MNKNNFFSEYRSLGYFYFPAVDQEVKATEILKHCLSFSREKRLSEASGKVTGFRIELDTKIVLPHAK